MIKATSKSAMHKLVDEYTKQRIASIKPFPGLTKKGTLEAVVDLVSAGVITIEDAQSIFGETKKEKKMRLFKKRVDKRIEKLLK